MKPHHHALLRWFNEFKIRDTKSDDDEFGSDDSDAEMTDNYLNRMFN